MAGVIKKNAKLLNCEDATLAPIQNYIPAFPVLGTDRPKEHKTI